LAVLKELENQLPDDTSMAQINIKMGGKNSTLSDIIKI
jgi:hypothetical protein